MNPLTGSIIVMMTMTLTVGKRYQINLECCCAMASFTAVLISHTPKLVFDNDVVLDAQTDWPNVGCSSIGIKEIEPPPALCDICNEEVTDGRRDVVTMQPRHKECIPY